MKRHSRAEISAALSRARDMTLRGQSQSSICKALGISVMTLHRWRKGFGESSENPGNGENLAHRDDTEKQIADLREENRSLRRIITDLLLDKARAEESVARHKTSA
jgi:putative transposase